MVVLNDCGWLLDDCYLVGWLFRWWFVGCGLWVNKFNSFALACTCRPTGFICTTWAYILICRCLHVPELIFVHMHLIVFIDYEELRFKSLEQVSSQVQAAPGAKALIKPCTDQAGRVLLCHYNGRTG